MVRVRIELTAFALSDHALPAELKDPTRQLKTLKHGIMQMEEGIFRHKKLRRITHSTICINSTNIADFNIFSIIHLKHFQAHTVFTRISVNKTFVCSLTVAERMFFRQNG